METKRGSGAWGSTPRRTHASHLSSIYIANGTGRVVGAFSPFPQDSTTKKNIPNSKLRRSESELKRMNIPFIEVHLLQGTTNMLN